MAHRHVADQVLHDRLGEVLRHESHAAMHRRLALAIHGDDPGTLLAPVLQRVQAEVGELSRLGNLRYANHTAHRSGLQRRIRGDMLQSPRNRVKKDAAEFIHRPLPAVAARLDGERAMPFANEAHRRRGNTKLGGEVDDPVGLGAGTGDHDPAMVLAEEQSLRIERSRRRP